MAAFPPPTRALLNPKFEGYKLQPLDQSELVYQYHLPVPTTQATVSGRSVLSFQEIADRIKHNHLAVAHNRRALYIDARGGVNIITLDEQSLEPAFHRIFEIPEQIKTDDTVDTAEYPSAVSLDAAHWIVSDGWGRLYVLRVSADEAAPLSGAVVAVAELTSAGLGPSSALVPCRLHHAVLGSDGVILLVLSVKIVLPREPSGSETRTEASKVTRFDLVTGRISVAGGDAVIQPVEMLWRRRGDSIPVSVSYDASQDTLVVISGSPYWDNDEEPVKEPAPDEYAPIPRADENLDTIIPARPPPYSWTQTGDSVTVAIPLPSATSKIQIKVHFSPRTLSLSIQDPTGALAELSSVSLPHYTLEQFWDGVSPASSFWTWDSQAERACGLLTLHLDKQHEGTRWPHVFATGDEVSETLDPSELWNIRESLEKYTADLGGAPGRGGLGLGGRDVSSLADGEMDDEADANVGTQVVVSAFSRAGVAAAPPAAPATLLSLPLPGASAGEDSLVLKHDIDGTVYAHSAAGWAHAATFPALAFVLASKRELRFVHHVGSRLLLAFEAGGADVGGNLYLYHGSAPKDKWAAQAVLKIGGGDSGALLGVGAIQTAGGQTVLLCLCERQIAVVRNGL